MEELCTKIRNLREDRDLKQNTVANQLGVSQQTYSNYENGRREIPTRAVVVLARFYRVSADYLLGIENGYLGSTDLGMIYMDSITVYDILCDIQMLNPEARRELHRFIGYLRHINSL